VYTACASKKGVIVDTACASKKAVIVDTASDSKKGVADRNRLTCINS